MSTQTKKMLDAFATVFFFIACASLGLGVSELGQIIGISSVAGQLLWAVVMLPPGFIFLVQGLHMVCDKIREL